MDSLPQTRERNYTPHLFETRLHCCRRIRESGWKVRRVLSYFYYESESLKTARKVVDKRLHF